MNCTESMDLLQRRLDGEPIADRSALEQHVSACLDCRQLHAAAGRLSDGLRLLPPIAPAPHLSAAIVAHVLADRRERQRLRRRWVGVAALAACLLLAVFIGQRAGLFNNTSPDDGKIAGPVAPTEPARPVVTTQPEKEPAGPSLRASLTEFGDAVASLTRRTASETVGQSRLLLPEVMPAPLPAVEPMPPMLDTPEPLKQASQGVSVALDPVTSSARRAFGMLLRENP